jgi:phosphatidylserine/phosphatidylglycerophosphate/cardiolipin synthase-like enzyme
MRGVLTYILIAETYLPHIIAEVFLKSRRVQDNPELIRTEVYFNGRMHHTGVVWDKRLVFVG